MASRKAFFASCFLTRYVFTAASISYITATGGAFRRSTLTRMPSPVYISVFLPEHLELLYFRIPLEIHGQGAQVPAERATAHHHEVPHAARRAFSRNFVHVLHWRPLYPT